MKSGLLKIIKDDNTSFDEMIDIISFHFDYPLLQCVSIVNIIETSGEAEVMCDELEYLEDISEVLIKEGLSVKIEVIENEK